MSPELIVLVGVLAGPLLLSWLTARQRRAERREEYARQDAVAAQAAETARRAAAEVARVAVAAAAATAAKLDEIATKAEVIHTLVNSNVTALKQSQLDGSVRELAMMKEAVALNEAVGREPTTETLAAIEATQTKIETLRTELEERAQQQALADEQANA